MPELYLKIQSGEIEMYDLKEQNFFETENNFMKFSDVKSEILYGIRKKNCDVSIMIPTYMRNKYLKETIKSALNQTTSLDVEIVVVDNDDDFLNTKLLEIIQQYPETKLCYYKNRKNLGMFGNWNRCLELAASNWVLILHDDDTISTDYISRMAEIAEEVPDLGCIGCLINTIDEAGKIVIDEKQNIFSTLKKLVKKRKVSDIRIQDFYFTHPLNIMGLFINREKAMEVGGFNPKWYPCSDYIFILNLVYRYPAKSLNEKLFNYRVAVNASLTPKHIVGMVEVDAFMREGINRKLKLVKNQFDKVYRSCYILFHEKYCLKKWSVNLQKKERVKIMDKYIKLNNDMEIIWPTKGMMACFYLFERGYRFYIRYIRKQ